MVADSGDTRGTTSDSGTDYGETRGTLQIVAQIMGIQGRQLQLLHKLTNCLLCLGICSFFLLLSLDC